MPKFEHIWRDQCEATISIKARYGEQAAFDYLVGEKLLHFVSAARDHPEFASQLPAFVMEIRQLFPGDTMRSHLEILEARLVAKVHDADDCDIESFGVEANELESLQQIADLLRSPHLGTA